MTFIEKYQVLCNVESNLEMKTNTVKIENIQEEEKLIDPILVDFEDTETRSQVHRSAFIDPAELDALKSARMEHEESEHAHGEHDQDNSTQSENPHGAQQFCVDISEYLDLKWVIKDSEECHVTFTR